MKIRTLLPLTLTTIVLASGCGLNSSATDNNGMMNYNSSTSMQNQKEADALAIVMTINNNEINSARVALAKSSNPMVRNYAKFLENQHTKNLQETVNLSHKLNIAPQKNKIALMLQNKGAQEVTMLNSLSGSALDKAYINAMVKDHAEGLQVIDHLLNKVTNPMVRNHLMMTRSHVAMHLKEARKIQQHMHN